MQITTAIGLAAACGCRLFTTLLIFAISNSLGLISGEGSWLSNPQTFIVFTLGTVIEVMMFYRPRLDNLMDAIALPSAFVAGVVVTRSVVYGLPPLWRWLAAIVLGGGVALIVQAATTLIRADLTTRSGGINNGVFATIELGTALGIVLMVLLEPRVTTIVVFVLLGFASRYLYQSIYSIYLKQKYQD